MTIGFGGQQSYKVFETMFSDEKHLSAIIALITGKSLKKALIEPKTSFNGQLVHFLGSIFF